jgi:hypothetical protein
MNKNQILEDPMALVHVSRNKEIQYLDLVETPRNDWI